MAVDHPVLRELNLVLKIESGIDQSSEVAANLTTGYNMIEILDEAAYHSASRNILTMKKRKYDDEDIGT